MQSINIRCTQHLLYFESYTDNTDPKYIDTGSDETSCTKCEQLSNDCMLQCDVCTQWVEPKK